jgi:hypothetical protein
MFGIFSAVDFPRCQRLRLSLAVDIARAFNAEVSALHVTASEKLGVGARLP